MRPQQGQGAEPACTYLDPRFDLGWVWRALFTLQAPCGMCLPTLPLRPAGLRPHKVRHCLATAALSHLQLVLSLSLCSYCQAVSRIHWAYLHARAFVLELPGMQFQSSWCRGLALSLSTHAALLCRVALEYPALGCCFVPTFHHDTCLCP